MTCIKAVEAGVDVIDTAISSFSGGSSQPATETLVYALEELGIHTGIDQSVLKKSMNILLPFVRKLLRTGH